MGQLYIFNICCPFFSRVSISPVHINNILNPHFVHAITTQYVENHFFFWGNSTLSLSLSHTHKKTHTLSLSALIKQKKTQDNNSNNNGIFHRQGFVPHSNGNPLTPRPLLRRPPSLLENLRHRPRHPPQQTDRQTRYSSLSLSLSLSLNQKTPPFLSRIFVLTKRFVLGGGGFLLSILGSGLSQIVLEAQKSVGWYHDESDSGVREDHVASTRRFLGKIF